MNNLLNKILSTDKSIIIEQQKSIIVSQEKEIGVLNDTIKVLTENQLEMASLKTFSLFYDYRNINSIGDKILNLREKKNKTTDEKSQLVKLEYNFNILSKRLKDNNIMQHFIKSQYLVSFIFGRLRDTNNIEMLEELKEERDKIKEPKWAKITKV